MADLLHDDVLDAALDALDGTSTVTLHLCSSNPGLTYATAISASLGNKAGPTIGAAADRTGGGRKRTVAAITDGSVTASGTAAYYALIDVTAETVLASGHLSAGKALLTGNPFTLTAFDIGIPDPA